MIQITSLHLTKSDMALLKKYSKYVLDKFVRRSVQNKALVRVKIVHKNDFDNYADIEDLVKFRAWVTYDGVVNDKKYFTVVLNIKQFNKRAVKPHKRLKALMIDLGHELVHVKQYLNCEIFDYVAGGVRYKGSYFDQSYQQSEEGYYDSPWEIEAYGRELGLYTVFVNKVLPETR